MIFFGDYIAVVQKEDCKGRNVLAPSSNSSPESERIKKSVCWTTRI